MRNRDGRAALPAVVVLALAAGAGCAGAGTSPATTPSVVATGAAATPKVDPNLRPCASVEASFESLRAPLGGWMPQAKPFDKKVASVLRTAATDVQHQAQTASGPAKQAMADWAISLMTLSNAMQGKDIVAVTTAAAKVKAPFTRLKNACHFDK